MPIDEGVRDYLHCNNCKYDGAQHSYGPPCENCKWNPTFEDGFETNDPSAEELMNNLLKGR